MHHGWYGPNLYHFSGLAFIGNLLMFLLILGLLVGLGIWVARGFGRSSLQSSGPTSDSALEIARERYARGEIDLSQFEEIKKNLQSP